MVPKTTPLISVIIPNLDGITYLPQCLSSLRKQTFDDFEIIVVDNGSVDGSAEFIKREFPFVRLIALSENSGFAGGCNIGIKASSGNYVALLNNDTEVDPHWLEELFKAAEKDSKTGMVASKILLNENTREIDSVGMLIHPDGIGRQRGRGEIDIGQFDNDDEVLYPSGCAALYKKKMLDEIGLFDEDFFAYCEDTDLGLRGIWAGWRAVLAPMAIVYHKYSASAGKYSAFKAMHVERNRMWVAVKNFPMRWLLMIPFHTLKRYAVQVYGVFLSKGSTAKFREAHSVRSIVTAMMEAYASALSNLPSMARKRKMIKKVLTSKDFISLLKRHTISASELVLKD
jgi:GT2 family glycosyltransferase